MSSHVSPALSRRWQRLPRRLRIVLATKPLAYWSLTVLVAGTVGYAMYSVVASADATKAGFGTMRAVVVAVRDVEPGARSTRATPRSVSCRSRWCPTVS